MTDEKPPFVSIVVPVLNEERYIAQCLESLLEQGAHWADGHAFEILVMDGGSSDRTHAIVTSVASTAPAVRLIDNPKRLQAAAMNLAARMASPRATVLLRADAHVAYPSGFLRACVEALLEKHVQSVVVPMITVGTTGFQRAVAAAQNSIVGNGGSRHRRAAASGYVEHGHHAAFDRAFFLSIGGYNATFSHNEDAEYDHRVALEGGRIWMCGDVLPRYFPRGRPWALAKQYFHHGAGRARTMLTHRMPPRLRQMAPLVILAGCLGGIFLSGIHPAFAIFPLAYTSLCFGYGVIACVRLRDPWLLASGPAATIMHISWAIGWISTFMKRVSARVPKGGSRREADTSAETSIRADAERT